MRRFLFTLWVILVPAGLGAQSLDGRVVSDRNHGGIPEAEVALLDRTGAVAVQTVTDIGGGFLFETVPDGEYTIRVTALGHTATAERRVTHDELPLTLTITVDSTPSGAGGIAIKAETRESQWRSTTQFITGKVLDGRTLEPIEAMDVIVRDLRGDDVDRTLSGRTGRFSVRVTQPGLYRVAVSRLGYDSTATAEVGVPPGQNLYVELHVQPAALEMEPIRVTAPRTVPYLEGTGFYDRERRGHGSFLGPDDLARVPTAFPSHTLRRIAGIRVTRGRIQMRGVTGFMGAPCEPKIVVDHMHVRGTRLDDIVVMQQVEAIEVYKGPASVPPQWRDAGTCGVIAVWTKH